MIIFNRISNSTNTIQGIEGGIVLGLAHGFVSSGLFICVGGVLYDRSSTILYFLFKFFSYLIVFNCLHLYLDSPILCMPNSDLDPQF